MSRPGLFWIAAETSRGTARPGGEEVVNGRHDDVVEDGDQGFSSNPISCWHRRWSFPHTIVQRQC